AAGTGNMQCQETDQFGNLVCSQIPTPSENFVPEDSVSYGSSSPPSAGIMGIPFVRTRYLLVKNFVLNLTAIALESPGASLNQTRHPGAYYFNVPVNLSIAPGDEGSQGNSLTTVQIISELKKLPEVSSRAVKNSLVTTISSRRVWNIAPVDNVTVLLGPGVIPDENYLAPNESALKASLPAVPSTIPERPIPLITPPKNTTPPVFIPPPPPVPKFNLTVVSYPPGALIVLNGNRTGTTPYTMTGIPTGVYTMNLTRFSYVPYGMAIDLDKDMNINVPLTSEMDVLFPKPGTSTGPNRYGGLYVTSFPGGLPLWIDGVEIKGGTPFLFYGLPEGSHTIQILKPDNNAGTILFTRNVWVYHDMLVRSGIDTEETHTSELVSITSQSYPDAEFTVNGQYPPGRVPAMLQIPMPRSFISVHSGDAYVSELVPSLNTETVPLAVNKPDEPHGLLKIESNPTGADILIDGFPTGKTTPQTFSEVSAGLHRIGISKPGYYPADEIVTVPITSDNSSVQRLFYPLENYGEGTIVVDSMPEGGGIYLNGWATGETTPHTFDHLKIGFYEVIVSRGEKPWIDQAELTPDKVYRIVADFNKIF
ncbi:MAG TPA: PEGA domain-containing protein, partial [Methanoregulaceae archaeon]|nr:PEGA domain-containing protein [Methanoregulaceae archaeon]